MLYRRKDSQNYWYKFTVNGKTIQRSTGTSIKEEAQRIADKDKAEAWDRTNGTYVPRWEEAAKRWVQESEKKSLKYDIYMLRWLESFLLGKRLDEIDNNLIDKIIKAKLEQTSKSRANRITSLISAILNKAKKEWGWIDSTPYIRKFQEPKKRVRWITKIEAERLLKELPPHLEAMARFNLATGLRMRNVTHLEWEQVDLQRRIAWIHSDQIKTGKALSVPLNKAAINCLKEQIGKHPVRVFTYNGRPVDEANTRVFRAALKRAGIENFRWHDFRHTWASWHVQNGTPLHVLKELGGWSNMDMVLKYAHLSHEHLADYADSVSFEVKPEIRKVK